MDSSKAEKLASELKEQIRRINFENNEEFINCYHTLKQAKFGVLSTSNSTISSFPIVFFLIREAIVVLLPIIYISKWTGLLKHEKVSITILKPSHMIVKGKAILDQGDLDNDWQKFLYLWEKKEPGIVKLLKKSETTSYYWKRAIVRIIPEKLVSESPDGIMTVHERRR